MEMKTYPHKELHTDVLSSIIYNNHDGNQIGNIQNVHHLETEKRWYVHTMEYNSAIKRNKMQ